MRVPLESAPFTKTFDDVVCQTRPVDAWRMVSMLPFYALSGEHDGDSDPSNDKHFDT